MTLLVVLHVLAAIFVVGPLCVAPLMGLRGISKRDSDRIHFSARQTVVFGAGSVVVGALGAAAVATSKQFDFTAPWVTISMTLYVVALAITFAATVPALRSAARIIEARALELGAPPLAVTGADEDVPSGHREGAVTATSEDVLSQSKLDSARGRVVVSAATVLLIYAAITVLMVTKPFGG